MTAKPKEFAQNWRKIKKPFGRFSKLLAPLRRGIDIEQIEIVITTKCTLKCKHCAHLIPYYRFMNEGQYEIHSDLNELLKTIEAFLESIDKVKIFRVLGGEPFWHPDLIQILEPLKATRKIKRLEVVTNATIVPSKEVLQSLITENLFVRISNYGTLSPKQGELIEALVSNDVHYSIHDCLKNKWGDLGEIHKRNRSETDLKEVYSKCTARTIFLIFDGKLYPCGRSPHSIKMGISPADDFCVDLINDSRESIREQIKSLKTLKYMKACDHCDGRRCGQNYKEIEPAIQFNSEEMKQFSLERQ